jgi:hypothetical protein
MTNDSPKGATRLVIRLQALLEALREGPLEFGELQLGAAYSVPIRVVKDKPWVGAVGAQHAAPLQMLWFITGLGLLYPDGDSARRMIDRDLVHRPYGGPPARGWATERHGTLPLVQP